jgi:hypothetical protein
LGNSQVPLKEDKKHNLEYHKPAKKNPTWVSFKILFHKRGWIFPEGNDLVLIGRSPDVDGTAFAALR